MAAVTARPPQCLAAASPAAVSTSFMIVPPWTLPARLASGISIWRARTTLDAEAGLGVRSQDIAVRVAVDCGHPARHKLACIDRFGEVHPYSLPIVDRGSSTRRIGTDARGPP